MSIDLPSMSQSKDIENLVNALSSSHLYSAPGEGLSCSTDERRNSFGTSTRRPQLGPRRHSAGVSAATSFTKPIPPVRTESYGPDLSIMSSLGGPKDKKRLRPVESREDDDPSKLRVLIVEARLLCP